MSHFSLTVVTSEEPVDAHGNPTEALKKALQPFHEFEFTGEDDEFVVDVDDTEELRAAYERETKTMLRSPSGELHGAYDDEFYRDPTPDESREVGIGSGSNGKISWHSCDWGDGRGDRAKVRFIPDGWEEVDIPYHEIMTFREFIKEWDGRKEVLPRGRDKYGFVEVTSLGEYGEVVRCVRRTNPNKKWDWWEVGGRWRGRLLLKESEWRCNSAKKSRIDFELMYEKADRAARGRYREAQKVIAGRRYRTWDDVREDFPDIDDARGFYNSQPPVVDLYKSKEFAWDRADDFVDTEDCYALRKAQVAISTFAILVNGEWHEKGAMGWFGMSHGDKDGWQSEFTALLDGVPGDHYITIVDCHI